jgi:methionyl-tRNA synthetase
MPKFYISTPLYYVNAKPHIGHSYTQIACDTVAKFMRMSGYEVFFLTGSDEHGEKIEKATLARGYKQGEEKKFVDEIVSTFKDLWVKLGIEYDHFIRTTEDYHKKCVQSILDKLYKEGKIYKKEYKGWYCTPCETFWTATQAGDGICPECKRPLEKLDEVNYFFKLSEYQNWLIDYINANPDFIRPDFRRNEVLGFLKSEELQDLCISRPKSRLTWGIELPFDKDFVTYVWFDALTNYISGAGYPHNMEQFNKLWPADFHVLGKDILRHHAVYWVIMLHAIGLQPPKSIFAHGWWVMKGEKMSKSKGNVVDPLDMIDKYGIDAYRYFLLREVAFGSDGSFSEEALITRFNSDLANDIGNLLSRSVSMIDKYFAGEIPSVGSRFQEPGSSGSGLGEELVKKASALAPELERSIPNFDFNTALTKTWEVIGIANKYIEESKPWILSKEGKTDELARVMYNLAESLRIVSIAVYPFMPATALNIHKQLGLVDDPKSMTLSSIKTWGGIKPGTKVSKSTPLFPRIEIKP